LLKLLSDWVSWILWQLAGTVLAALAALCLYPADTVSGKAPLLGSVTLVEGCGTWAEQWDSAVITAGAQEQEMKMLRVDRTLETTEVKDVLLIEVRGYEEPEIRMVVSGSLKNSIWEALMRVPSDPTAQPEMLANWEHKGRAAVQNTL
jgi:hypothetical protein